MNSTIPIQFDSRPVFSSAEKLGASQERNALLNYIATRNREISESTALYKWDRFDEMAKLLDFISSRHESAVAQ